MRDLSAMYASLSPSFCLPQRGRYVSAFAEALFFFLLKEDIKQKTKFLTLDIFLNGASATFPPSRFFFNWIVIAQISAAAAMT